MNQPQPAPAPETLAPLFNKVISDEIKLSPTALEQMKALASAEPDIEGIRIFVAGGGCGGMTYSMTYATERNEHDAVLESDGLNVYVDAVALNFLEGVEIDFEEKPTGASFVFKNVFQAIGGGGTCGACGAVSAGGGCA